MFSGASMWGNCQELIFSCFLNYWNWIPYKGSSLFPSACPGPLPNLHLLKFCANVDLHYVYKIPQKTSTLTWNFHVVQNKIQYIALRENVGQSSCQIYVDMRPVSHTSLYRQANHFCFPPPACTHISAHTHR